VPRVWLGIDPGLKGGIAWIEWGLAATVTVAETPVEDSVYMEQRMVEIFRHVIEVAGDPANVFAAIEKSQAMVRADKSRKGGERGQGTASAHKSGFGWGLWRGMMAHARIPYDVVTPQAWKKGVSLKAGASKAEAVELAERLFPAAAEQFRGPRGGLRDGPADAALIAEHRRRIG
jgi:crossover junction endodeoxyribonuclease RuvC